MTGEAGRYNLVTPAKAGVHGAAGAVEVFGAAVGGLLVRLCHAFTETTTEVIRVRVPAAPARSR